jgi:hypothetical protein
MSLPAHWINNQWEFERKVLNFCFVTDHTGDTLGRKVEDWESTISNNESLHVRCRAICCAI